MSKEKELLEQQNAQDSKIFSMMESDVSTSEEALAKSVMTLAKTEDPKILTEIDKDEIILLTAIHMQSILLEDPSDNILNQIAVNFERLRVSLDRKGRNEIMQIAKATHEEEIKQSKLKRFLGLGGGRI